MTITGKVFCRPSSLVAALLILFFRPDPALPETAAGSLEVLEKKVVEATFPNGLKVVLLPRHQSPTVSLYLRFMVGAVEERNAATGLAHLLEHMMFKGTSRLGTKDYAGEKPLREKIERTAAALDEQRRRGVESSPGRMSELAEELRTLQEEARRYVVKDEIASLYTANGARGFNASTSADLTTYKVSLPANRIELWALIESERLRDPVMREFYSERDVVVEERRQSIETDPARKLLSLLLATAFQVHPYRRPVIGWEGGVDFLRTADAEEFYRTYYTPGNAVLAAVGDFVPERMLAVLRKYFGPLHGREVPRRLPPAEPRQEGERRAVLLMDAQPELLIAFHKPTLPSREDYVFDLIDGILTSGRTSRLYQKLVEEDQLALSVSTTNGVPGARYPNLFVVRATPKRPHGVAEIEMAVLQQLELLRREPVPEEELRRVKNQMRAALLRGLKSNDGLASLLSYFEAAAGDWRYAMTHLDVLDSVTPSEIQDVAARYLTARNRSVVELQTEKPAVEEGQ